MLKLLLLFCLISSFSWGQEPLNPPALKDSIRLTNARLDSVVKASVKIIDYYSPEAQFPGGNMALIRFVLENTEYPEEALKEGIEGKVYMKFAVEADGSLTNIKVTRSVHPLLDAEAIRVISAMPNWEPAEDKGTAIRTMVRLPITFVLSEEEEP